MPKPQSTPRPDTEPAAAPDALAVPQDLDEAALALATGGAAGTTAAAAAAREPTLDPPGTPGAARTAAKAFPTVRVLALFSSANPTNGWAYLENVGWRRLATGSASAHVNLGLLAAGARDEGTPTPVRHEGDNQIHEIYLW